MIPARGPQTVVEQSYIEYILAILKFQIYFQAVRARAAVITGKNPVAHARGKLLEASAAFWKLSGSFLEASGCNILQFLGPGRGRHTFRGSSVDLRGSSAAAFRMAASVVGASLGRLSGGSYHKTNNNPSSASTI